jgi:pSer/pThr/pTyr-binding forkhead associated (FHA) protein
MLTIFYRPDKSGNYIQVAQYPLDRLGFATRIGRSKHCEVCVDFAGNMVSSYHLTLFKYFGSNSHQLMDGTIEPITLDCPHPKISPSSNGTWYNGRRLEIGEKVNLRNGDEIELIGGILKIVYQRSGFFEEPLPLDVTDLKFD